MTVPVKRLDQNLPTLLWRHALEFKWLYVLAIISLYMTHELQSRLPYFAKELGDLLYFHRTIEISYFKYILIAVGIIIFRTSSRLLFFYPARIMQKNHRVELIERLENAHPLRYSKINSGQIYQILFNDLGQFRALVGFAFLQIGNVIIALWVLLPKIMAFEGHLYMAFIPLLICLLAFSIVSNLFQKFFKQAQDQQGEVQNFLIESYHGKKSIKNFGAEFSFLTLFREQSTKELQFFFKAGVGISSTLPLVKFGVGMSLIWAAYLVNRDGIPATSLILFSGFLYLLLEPLMMLSWVGMVAIRSKSSWIRLKDLVEALKVAHPQELELQELSLKENPEIKFWGKNLTIPLPASWTALVGETGSGKTKILFDIADLYRLKGEVISLVAQEPFLYNSTVEKNIFLGKTPSEQEKMTAFNLLMLFQLQDLGKIQDEVMNLEVGENGKRLSGGQIKRLSIVRSILSGAHILLWDDPFSSVDLILEKEILNKLKDSEHLKNKKVILTSHRLSTVKFCDEVILIGKNQGILDSGATKKMLSDKTKVYEFFEKQMA